MHQSLTFLPTAFTVPNWLGRSFRISKSSLLVKYVKEKAQLPFLEDAAVMQFLDGTALWVIGGGGAVLEGETPLAI